MNAQRTPVRACVAAFCARQPGMRVHEGKLFSIPRLFSCAARAHHAFSHEDANFRHTSPEAGMRRWPVRNLSGSAYSWEQWRRCSACTAGPRQQPSAVERYRRASQVCRTSTASVAAARHGPIESSGHTPVSSQRGPASPSVRRRAPGPLLSSATADCQQPAAGPDARSHLHHRQAVLRPMP